MTRATRCHHLFQLNNLWRGTWYSNGIGSSGSAACMQLRSYVLYAGSSLWISPSKCLGLEPKWHCHFGIPRQHRRLHHVSTLMVGRLGDLWEWTVLNHQHFLSPSTFFGLPLVQFFFLCLSLSLVFFLVFFACFWFLFPFFLIFLSSWLLFSEKNNMKCLNCNLFFHQYFFFFMVSCLVFSLSNPFLFLFFLVFSYVFCWTSMFLVSKKPFLQKHQFLVKRWVATKRFFFL